LLSILGKEGILLLRNMNKVRSNLKMEDAIKLANLYEIDIQELSSVIPLVSTYSANGKKTHGFMSVLVDLIGSSLTLEGNISKLKRINYLLT